MWIFDVEQICLLKEVRVLEIMGQEQGAAIDLIRTTMWELQEI